MPVPVVTDIVRSGRNALGAWQFIGSPDVTTIIGAAGFDFVLIDTEHSGLTMDTVRACINAATVAGMATLIRVPERGQAFQIEQVLDAGAQGVLVPMIETAEQAQAVVDAVRFPPIGDRGFCPAVQAARFGARDNYIEDSNRELLVGVLVETPLGVENLDEILAVDGVDAVQIGRADLGVRLGTTSRSDAIRTLERDLAKRVVESGKALWIWEDFNDATTDGASSGGLIICGAVDVGSLARQMRDARAFWEKASNG